MKGIALFRPFRSHLFRIFVSQKRRIVGAQLDLPFERDTNTDIALLVKHVWLGVGARAVFPDETSGRHHTSR